MFKFLYLLFRKKKNIFSPLTTKIPILNLDVSKQFAVYEMVAPLRIKFEKIEMVSCIFSIDSRLPIFPIIVISGSFKIFFYIKI